MEPLCKGRKKPITKGQGWLYLEGVPRALHGSVYTSSRGICVLWKSCQVPENTATLIIILFLTLKEKFYLRKKICNQDKSQAFHSTEATNLPTCLKGQEGINILAPFIIWNASWNYAFWLRDNSCGGETYEICWYFQKRLGVSRSKLQLPAYTTARATRDLSHVCGLYPSQSNAGSEPRLWPTPQPEQRGIWATSAAYTPGPRQRRILTPLSEAKDQTRTLMDPSWVH